MRFSSFHPATTGVQGSAPSNIGTIPNVTGTPSISATTSITKDGVVKVYLAGSWNAVADASSYDIEINNSTISWVISSPVVSISNFELEVKPSSPLSYTIRVKAVNKNGVRSDNWSNTSNAIVAVGDLTPPAEVTSLSVIGGMTTIKFTWTDPTDVDFSHVKIYGGTSSTTKINILPQGKWVSPGGKFQYDHNKWGETIYFWVATVDTSGNESVGVASGPVTLPIAGPGSLGWNSSNDGAGSGLDADLLDGYESADFLRKSETPTITSTWSFVSNALVSASDYYGSSTWTQILSANSVSTQAALALRAKASSGNFATGSLHVVPVAEYRSGLVATYSADGSGAGYFAVNQFVPTSSTTLERLRVDAEGNLGVGLSNPTSKLDTLTTTGTTGTNTIVARFNKNSTNGAGSSILRLTSDGVSSDFETNSAGNGGSFRFSSNYGDTNIANLINATNGPYGNINFVTNSAIRMTIGAGTQAGSIGIGTASPSFVGLGGNSLPILVVNGSTASGGVTKSDARLGQSTALFDRNGWWGIRAGTDNSFNIDTYNDNNPLSPFTVFQDGTIRTAGGMKKYTVTTPNQGNSNSKYELMRISRDPLNWSPNSSYIVTIHNKYFSGGGRTVWHIAYGIDSSGTISCIDARGPAKFKLYFGAEVIINANVAYRPVFVDIVEYRDVSIEVEFNTNVVTSITDEAQVHFTGTMTTGTGALYSGDTHIVPDGGNLGIGTTNPQHRLTVTGGNLAVESGSAYLSSSYALHFNYGVDNNYYINKNGTTLLMNTGGNFAMMNGRLGIGTTSPDGTLTIFNSATFNARTSGINVHRPSSYGQYGSMSYDGDTTYFSSTYTGGGSGGYGAFVFQSYDSTSTPIERLRINRDTGNVGINMASPSTKVHAAQSISRSTILDTLLLETAVNGGTGAAYYGGLRFAGNGYDWGAIRPIQTDPSVSWVNRLAFFTMNGNGGSLLERLSIDNAGNVGIGTTTPGQKLHVNGMTQTVALYNSAWNRSQTDYGYIDFGPANAGHGHIYTDRPTFYFNKEIFINGATVWNSGNDGSGSGLDADLLKGKTIAESTVGDTIVSRNGGGRFSAAGIDFLGSSQGDLVNNSPWYGVGKSDITSFGGGGNVIQMAGYYGLRIRSANSTMDFYQNGRIITTVPTNKDFRVDGILNATRGIIDYSIDDNSSRPARILMPEGGARVGSAGSETGAIKIELPADRYVGNSMMTFTVCIYEYTTGRTRRILCGGYNYSYWVYTSAIQQTESGGNINVRFGRQSSRDCVWIGETNTVWSYPQVWIEDVNIGYAGFSNAWATGWAISLVTSFGTVENTHVAYAQWHGGNDGSGSGLDADLLDGYDSSTASEVANTIPVRDGSGYLNQRVIRNVGPTYNDGMYIGYANTGSGATRIYGGGSSSANLTIQATSMTAPGEVYTPSGSYFRAVGTGGFYCETYNGGWNMTDGTWLRSIADKGILTGGAIQGATVTATSDLRLKENVTDLSHALDLVLAMQPRRFNWKKDGRSDIGAIAQELELIVPEVVYNGADDTKTVNYGALGIVAIAAIQELHEIVAALKTRIKVLEAK